MDNKLKKYLEVGKLVNTHGIRGELKLELWCDDIDYVKQFKILYLDENGKQPLHVVSVRPQKNMAIIKFSEITSIEQAEKFKGRIIYGSRNDAHIDEDANYIQDIIGCYVIDIDTEEEYGRVVDVQNYGASDILDIEDREKHKYIPVIPDIVKEIDIEYQVVKIKPMKGLFDED